MNAMLPFNWENYLEPNDLGFTVELSFIYWVTLTIIYIVNGIILVKFYRSAQKNDCLSTASVKNCLWTMIGLLLLPLGSYIGVWTRLLTNGTYKMLSLDSNVFVPTGYIIIAISFTTFITEKMHSPFFQKRNQLWQRINRYATMFILFLGFIMYGRFLLLGVMPIDFRNQTKSLMSLVTIVIPGISIMLALLSAYFLIQERKTTTSRVVQHQLRIFMYIPLVLCCVLLFSAVIQLTPIIIPDGYIYGLVILSTIMYTCTMTGMISLWIGMFPSQRRTEKWLQEN